MILDQQQTLSAAQAVTAIGDTVSTNTYDTGQPYDANLGGGHYVMVRVGAGVTSGGSPTVQVVLQDSADGSSWADAQLLTPALAPAALTASKILVRSRLPAGLRRYVRVVYRVATATLTAGTFTALMLSDVQAQQYGASGFAVQ